MGMTVDELAAKLGAKVRGDGSIQIDRCATLDEAGPKDVSFLANRKYVSRLATTTAGAIILSNADADTNANQLDATTVLIVDDPYAAFREAVVILHGFQQHPEPGISDRAIIDPNAKVGNGCSIQPMAYIANGASIGDNCVIYPHCYVGANSVIGDGSVLHPNVTVYHDCELGKNVTLHAGCVIGQDGFGYATHSGAHHKIPHIGRVLIEDDVEMGAGCVVDRATLGVTRIGKGTKFSDLVTIGHGASIGRHNLLVAQVGIAGSTQTGDYVVMGGQAGVAGHLEIGDGAQVAAKAGVIDNLPAGGKYGGQPALPMNQTKRNVLAVTRLPELLQEVRKLQKKLEKLESQAHTDRPSTIHQ